MLDIPSNTPAQAIVHLVSKPQILLGARANVSAKKPNNDSYENLICSERDKACVHEIITTLGERGKIYLLFNQGHINDLGDEIEHLHPLKFLTSIFCYPHIKRHMPEIYDDYFKRNGFMGGLAPNLSRESEKGKLNQYLGKFAQEIKVPLDKMRPFFDTHNWEGLVEFLITYKE